MPTRGAYPAETTSADALATALERAGLVEARIEGGQVRYRTTRKGEQVRRMLATADQADAEALLDRLLGSAEDAKRSH